jgi:transcription antitermination factor NusG
MWYAIQTRVRREELVANLLAGKGYEIFLPTYESERPWRGRSREVKFPLFPGYLFCQFDVQKRLPVLVTPGVVGVVGNGRTPTAVPPSEISASEAWFCRACRLSPGLIWNADKESESQNMPWKVWKEYWSDTKAATGSLCR